MALPPRVAGIGLRQPVDDREAVAIGLERVVEATLRDLHVADLLVRNGEFALIVGIVRIGFGEAIDDRETLAMGLQRAGEVALRDLHITNPTTRRI